MKIIDLAIAARLLHNRKIERTAHAQKHWVTTETGSHVQLDGDGTILAGMGGKFTGLSMSDVKKQDGQASHGNISQVKESPERKQGRLESNSSGAIRDRMMGALKNRNDKILEANYESRKKHEIAQKELSDKYDAMTPAGKRKHTKEFGKPSRWDTTGLKQDPILSPESAGLNPNDFMEKSNNWVSTSHHTDPADMFSERGAAKTSHEFEDPEDADNYIDKIDSKLIGSGYEKKEADDAVTYTKGITLMMKIMMSIRWLLRAVILTKA
jgi:hypothetical protein